MREPEEKLIDTLDKLGLEGWGIKFTVADECCWSGEVRLTEETHPQEADVSTVLFIGGCADFAAAVRRLQGAVDAWAKARREP